MAKRALGKGLGALMPTEEPVFQEGEAINSILLTSIVANSHQPRKNFDEEALGELAVSIKEKGLIQPIVVVRNGEEFELVSGERRTRAAKLAGLREIPAIIRSYDDKDKAEISLIENIQREDLDKIEEAMAYKALMNEFSLTQSEMSEKVGKSRAHIANTVRLLELSKCAKEHLARRDITPGHARAMLTLTSKQQEILCKRIIAEDLSVRMVEKIIKELNKPKTERKRTFLELPVEIIDLQETLQEKFGTKVKIKYQEEKGKIEIEYYSSDDLLRLSDILLEL